MDHATAVPFCCGQRKTVSRRGAQSSKLATSCPHICLCIVVFSGKTSLYEAFSLLTITLLRANLKYCISLDLRLYRGRLKGVASLQNTSQPRP